MIAAKTRRETKDLEVEDIIEEKSLKEIRNYNVILGSEKDIISLRINLDFFGILKLQHSRKYKEKSLLLCTCL